MNKRKEIIKNNLREYRIKAGLTQKQVAETLGLDCENRLAGRMGKQCQVLKIYSNYVNYLK